MDERLCDLITLKHKRNIITETLFGGIKIRIFDVYLLVVSLK